MKHWRNIITAQRRRRSFIYFTVYEVQRETACLQVGSGWRRSIRVPGEKGNDIEAIVQELERFLGDLLDPVPCRGPILRGSPVEHRCTMYPRARVAEHGVVDE